MIKRMSAVLALAAFAFGCAHDPMATPPTDDSPSPAWNQPAGDHRHPSSDTFQYISEGQTKKLSSCGGHDGYARLTRTGSGQLVMQLRNIDCAQWTSKTMHYATQDLNYDQGSKQHWADVPVDETASGWHRLIVGSKNYMSYVSYGDNPPASMKGDIVDFYVPARPVTLDLIGTGKSSRMTLHSCGGSVEAKIDSNGAVNVVFRDVANCSGFELLSNDGQPLNYQKDLDVQGGSYGGSRSIPKKFVDEGHNGITARVFRYGGGEDRIFLRFLAY